MYYISTRATLLLTFLLFSCVDLSQTEPPFSLGEGKPGEMVRSTKLVGMEQGREGGPPHLVYDVFYPANKLRSRATLEMLSGALLEEVFPGKWRVEYVYRDLQDRFMQLPIEISIYTDADGARGKRVNNYIRVDLVTNKGGLYRGEAGNTKLISFQYLEVMPGGGVGGFPGGMGGIGRF
ncbi:MAG: hypothetical protein COT91_04305 [Candidatus Doudnabacteria bacterium CG10_big_fil_rev_8_21_14_0_10_41_10]|uniref:Lipoprotein n=1 Tax=Candidatus Doudnabacteria bacterium CG10_big_fil_rev_8_21_14_0_10_41_10 TaxID=1974551 RepID=A0A2H0VCR4_9BACT|nr:MAG: hypothetical protein COT91_04305 [Candidatus Doudnabacteria bacterium CG10_big_fil_rev_8_21_14_0_10_41_10]